MIRDHAAFEALGGAVALGEASEEERSAFARHAAECAACACDALDGAPLEMLREAREIETWRPNVEAPLLARVRETRSRSVRRTFGVLGYAAGLSIVLNVAVATGFAGRLYARFEDASRPVAVPVAALQAPQVAARPAPVLATPHYYIQRPLTAPLPAKPQRRHPRDAAGRLGEVPDVLAGLVQPASVTASRDVAQEAFSLDATPADRPH